MSKAARLFTLGVLAGLSIGLFPITAGANPTFVANDDCNCSVDVQNFGGPTMTGVTDVYAIWYGDWGADPTIPAVDQFFSHLTGSDYLNLALTYNVSNQINFEGNYFTNTSSRGTITDRTLSNVVTELTRNGSGINAENNAIYFILTPPNITSSDYPYNCSYHTDTYGLKYAWIGSNYSTGCGDTTIDAVTVEASHELFETLTDPYVADTNNLAPPLAWYDGGPNDQGEVADICSDGVGKQTSLNGFEAYVNPIFVRDPNYVSASGVRTGGYCALGNPLTSAASVPEAETWLLMMAGLVLMGLERTSRATHRGDYGDGVTRLISFLRMSVSASRRRPYGKNGSGGDLRSGSRSRSPAPARSPHHTKDIDEIVIP